MIVCKLYWSILSQHWVCFVISCFICIFFVFVFSQVLSYFTNSNKFLHSNNNYLSKYLQSNSIFITRWNYYTSFLKDSMYTYDTILYSKYLFEVCLAIRFNLNWCVVHSVSEWTQWTCFSCLLFYIAWFAKYRKWNY